MKTSELLRKAHKYLWDGRGSYEGAKPRFICWAVDEAADAAQGEEDADVVSRRVTDQISRLLGKHVLVTQWLYAKGLISSPATAFLSEDERLQVQLYRHRWLDALIAEYEAKGD